MLEMILGYMIVMIEGKGMGIVKGIDLKEVKKEEWLGMKNLKKKELKWKEVKMIDKVEIVIVEEKIGKIKDIG